jgi:hypothetical protein
MLLQTPRDVLTLYLYMQLLTGTPGFASCRMMLAMHPAACYHAAPALSGCSGLTSWLAGGQPAGVQKHRYITTHIKHAHDMLNMRCVAACYWLCMEIEMAPCTAMYFFIHTDACSLPYKAAVRRSKPSRSGRHLLHPKATQFYPSTSAHTALAATYQPT